MDTLKIEQGSPSKIQKVINFDWDVWLRHIIYQNALNRTTKSWENSNSHNFWLWYPIKAHYISKHFKLKKKNSWANSNEQYFWLGCLTEAYHISKCSKLNEESLLNQIDISLDCDAWLGPIIYGHARNWTM